jgi:hypothetical protein
VDYWTKLLREAQELGLVDSAVSEPVTIARSTPDDTAVTSRSVAMVIDILNCQPQFSPAQYSTVSVQLELDFVDTRSLLYRESTVFLPDSHTQLPQPRRGIAIGPAPHFRPTVSVLATRASGRSVLVRGGCEIQDCMRDHRTVLFPSLHTATAQ